MKYERHDIIRELVKRKADTSALTEEEAVGDRIYKWRAVFQTCGQNVCFVLLFTGSSAPIAQYNLCLYCSYQTVSQAADVARAEAGRQDVYAGH